MTQIPIHSQNTLLIRLQEFLRLESVAGIVLVLAALAGMVCANTDLAQWYHHILHEVNFTVGFTDTQTGLDFALTKSTLHWVNDGLMAIFFFLVGLEIKREMKEGELSSRDRAVLPFIGAVGGMAVPALIFWLFNRHQPEFVHGWAIPSATDIAFTLGVLALLGSRIPLSIKILVTAIAIIDDLGAIVIIALFYSGISFWPAFWAALSAVACLLWMNARGIVRPAAYVLVGFLLWLMLLKSGLHATLAGVITAFCIPMRNPANPDHMPGRELEHHLHPWVAFLILPLFAFANAGVSLSGVTWSVVADPIVQGIAFGLFFGKQIGIFLFLAAAILFGLSPKPQEASWIQLYGMAVLCGIGFTMSLFIGGLAYADPALQVQVRVGVIGGSIASALVGYLVLRFVARPG